MSFRKNNKKEGAERRNWEAFCEANWGLIEQIGLSLVAIETLDRFYYLLMHDCMYPIEDASRFDILELRDTEPERFELFKLLMEKYFEAGFHDPGMHPTQVGGEGEYYKLVRQYPTQFSTYTVERANELAEEERLRQAELS